MAYVTSWRMDLAARLLEDGELSVGRVAGRVGYTSEAAFNRAFQRIKGVTPGRWRRPSPLEDAVPASLTAVD
jgi:AraC-like DNA-binding protein